MNVLNRQTFIGILSLSFMIKSRAYFCPNCYIQHHVPLYNWLRFLDQSSGWYHHAFSHWPEKSVFANPNFSFHSVCQFCHRFENTLFFFANCLCLYFLTTLGIDLDLIKSYLCMHFMSLLRSCVADSLAWAQEMTYFHS